MEVQTLRCIIEGGGDVAFINTFHLNQYLGNLQFFFFFYQNIMLLNDYIFIDILRLPMNLDINFNAHNFSTVCNKKIRSSAGCPMSWSNFGYVS